MVKKSSGVEVECFPYQPCFSYTCRGSLPFRRHSPLNDQYLGYSPLVSFHNLPVLCTFLSELSFNKQRYTA